MQIVPLEITALLTKIVLLSWLPEVPALLETQSLSLFINVDSKHIASTPSALICIPFLKETTQMYQVIFLKISPVGCVKLDTLTQQVLRHTSALRDLKMIKTTSMEQQTSNVLSLFSRLTEQIQHLK